MPKIETEEQFLELAEKFKQDYCLGSRLADLHLILPNEVPQLSC